jgi:Kef-type K+ transport system membrane component KefB
MILAGSVGKDHILIRRLRTLCFGFLTPFYFIRAGSFVSVPDLIAAPAAFLLMLVVKLVTKIAGIYPVTLSFGAPRKEAMYTTLLMSTGLTFGTISSLFGLSHGIIDQAQYSGLVAAVIGSAVVPTLIANAFYLPPDIFSPTGSRREERYRRGLRLLPSAQSVEPSEIQGGYDAATQGRRATSNIFWRG